MADTSAAELTRESGPAMFSPVDSTWLRRRALYISCLFHGIVFAWLLYPAAAAYIKPQSLMAGEQGASTTRVYWLARATDSRLPSESASSRLVWQKPAKKKKDRHQKSPRTAPDDQFASARPDPGPLAGSPYGSLAYGDVDGFEVRPAIRVSGSEPVVSSGDLAGLAEGNEIIEVTIDESGNIIRKVVLQSLGPAIDNRVLAALEDWRFLPATRDGVAIPSKQDVHYHYPVPR
jgi:TonB family protein